MESCKLRICQNCCLQGNYWFISMMMLKIMMIVLMIPTIDKTDQLYQQYLTTLTTQYWGLLHSESSPIKIGKCSFPTQFNLILFMKFIYNWKETRVGERARSSFFSRDCRISANKSNFVLNYIFKLLAKRTYLCILIFFNSSLAIARWTEDWPE